MKKTFLLLFSMVLMVGLLAACGSAENSGASDNQNDKDHIVQATAKDHQNQSNVKTPPLKEATITKSEYANVHKFIQAYAQYFNNGSNPGVWESKQAKQHHMVTSAIVYINYYKEKVKDQKLKNKLTNAKKAALKFVKTDDKESLKHLKKAFKQLNNEEQSNKPRTIVITSDILKKINRHFNSDLPFKQKEKYVVKRVGHDPSWGARYENGITIDDKGVMTAWKGDHVKTQLMPFQVRPYLRAILGGETMAVLADNNELIENGMMSGKRVNFDKIKKAKQIYSQSGINKSERKKMKKFAKKRIQSIQNKLTLSHIDKFSNIKHYMKNSIPLLEKATHGDYMAYLKAIRRDLLLSAVLRPRTLKKYVQFK